MDGKMDETPRQQRDRVLRKAKENLDRGGNRLGLIVCILACILATVSVILIVTALNAAFDFGGLLGSSLAIILLNLLQTALCFFAVWPMYLGTFHVALEIGRGQSADFLRIFDFYSSFALLCRAWQIQLHVLLRSYPLVLVIVLPYVTLLLPTDIALVVGVILALAEPFLIFWGLLTSNRIFPMVALTFDEPEMPAQEAAFLAYQMTEGQTWSIFAMRVRLLWRFALSLLSIGIVTLIHVLPLALLAYSEYASEFSIGIEEELF